MERTILVAGATGDLGERICKALLARGADVRAVVRPGSDAKKVKKLEQMGVTVLRVDMDNINAVTVACHGVSCVVSALSGFRDTILGTQKVLLDAAVRAGVPRFIPSDYSLDFTPFKAGENRNLDLRRAFHTYLDNAPISMTTIFNGAFADMITGQAPIILSGPKRVLYWGDADHRMAFTTKDNTAEFTAHAALDTRTPRFLRIAGDQISPRQIRQVVSEVTGRKFGLLWAGSPLMLSGLIKIAQKVAPGDGDLYPAWQGMQYLRNMIDKRARLDGLDNDRYPSIRWTTIRDVLTAQQKEAAAQRT